MTYNTIDIEKAMGQLGGSEKLYHTVLSGFYSRYKQVDVTIATYLEEKETEEARRLAHSMKGLSGNLGSEELRRSAMELEHAIKEGSETIGDKLQAFSKVLTMTLMDVEAILEQRYKDMGIVETTEVHGREQFVEDARQLVFALSTYRYGEVKRALRMLREKEVPKPHTGTMDSVYAAIVNYEYDEAIGLLRKITDE